jgi:SAM-dependent methyltransferase
MTMRVLGTKAEIRAARRALETRRLSHVASPLARWCRRFYNDGRIIIGDVLKSWDVLVTIDFLEARVPRDQPILDIGAYASEVLLSLASAGYTNLTGADLNPEIPKMPGGDKIRWTTTDFLHTPFASASFAAITSISVIEHGFDADRLLAEASRLLAPGGYFIASFDYWPDKIDTRGVRFFDMDWRIFSADEVRALIDRAAHFGLVPVGELSMSARERPIRCAHRDYTFAWLALERSRHE